MAEDRLIKIKAGQIEVVAKLNHSTTADKIYKALPLTGKVARWGKEIYFPIPVTVDQSEDARTEMEVGELAYWPVGKAFCIFFGPTPASIGQVPMAASEVNPIGRVETGALGLAAVTDGEAISVKKLEQ